MGEQENLSKLEELKKQREEIDKLISEMSTQEARMTNISYTKNIVDRYIMQRESSISNMNPQELLEIKMFVNKKCNQISSDYEHTRRLVLEILPWKENGVFIEIFARKVLEQGRIQVSTHFESYKPLSYIMHAIDSDKMIDIYISLMMVRKGTETELCGIYAIYFGYLRLKEEVQGCWFWLASVLNCCPSEYSGYILETCLNICGEMLLNKCRMKFIKILKYIKNYYIKEIKNIPVETRLCTLIEKLSTVQ